MAGPGFDFDSYPDADGFNFDSYPDAPQVAGHGSVEVGTPVVHDAPSPWSLDGLLGALRRADEQGDLDTFKHVAEVINRMAKGGGNVALGAFVNSPTARAGALDAASLSTARHVPVLGDYIESQAAKDEPGFGPGDVFGAPGFGAGEAVGAMAVPAVRVARGPGIGAKLANVAANVGWDATQAGVSEFNRTGDVEGSTRQAAIGGALGATLRGAGGLAAAHGRGQRVLGRAVEGTGRAAQEGGRMIARGGQTMQDLAPQVGRGADWLQGSAPQAADVLRRGGGAAVSGGEAIEQAGRAAQRVAPVAQQVAGYTERAGDVVSGMDIRPETQQVRDAVGAKFDELLDPRSLERGANEYTAAAAGMRNQKNRRAVEALPGGAEGFGKELRRLGIGTGAPSGKSPSRLPQSVDTYVADAEAIMDKAGKARARTISRVTKKGPIDLELMADEFTQQSSKFGQMPGQEGLAAQLSSEAQRLAERPDELTAETLWNAIKANRRKARSARQRGDVHEETLAEVRDQIWNDVLDAHVLRHSSKRHGYKTWKQSGRDYMAAVNAQKIGDDIRNRGVQNRTFSLTDYVAMSGGGILGAAGAVGNRLVRDFEKDVQARLYSHLAQRAKEGRLPTDQIARYRQLAERGVERLEGAPQAAGQALRVAGQAGQALSSGIESAGTAAEIGGQGLATAGRAVRSLGERPEAVSKALGGAADVARLAGSGAGTLGKVAELGGKGIAGAGWLAERVGRGQQRYGRVVGASGQLVGEGGARAAGRDLHGLLRERSRRRRDKSALQTVRSKYVAASRGMADAMPAEAMELLREGIESGDNATLAARLREIEQQNPALYRRIIGARSN